MGEMSEERSRLVYDNACQTEPVDIGINEQSAFRIAGLAATEQIDRVLSQECHHSYPFRYA